MRTAILGLGGVAERIHLPACRTLDELQVVAACEPVAERRTQMQARFHLPAVCADAQTLLEKERPEPLIVGTPRERDHARRICRLECARRQATVEV